jgi:hypothetical protein
MDKWLNNFVDPYNYHEYKIDSSGKKHVYPKQTIKEMLERTRLKPITSEVYNRHVNQEQIIGFTNNPANSQWLIQIDIDATDSIAAIQARDLIVNLYPELSTAYYEASTRGNGIHIYPVIDKGDENIDESVKVIKSFVLRLSYVCLLQGINISAVEVQGFPYQYEWNNGKITKAKGSTYGPAKLPFGKIESSVVIQLASLREAGFTLTGEAEDSNDQDSKDLINSLNNNKVGGQVHFSSNSVSNCNDPVELFDKALDIIWDKSCKDSHFRILNRWISKDEFIILSQSWFMCCIANENPEKSEELRYTVPLAAVEGMYGWLRETRLKRKIGAFKREKAAWVQQQLERLGILLCRNREFFVGAVGRRWGFSFQRMKECVKSPIDPFTEYVRRANEAGKNLPINQELA